MFTKCMNYHWILYLNTTTGVISGAGTAHFSRADEFIPVFCEVHAAQSLVFCEKTIVLVFFLLSPRHNFMMDIICATE